MKIDIMKRLKENKMSDLLNITRTEMILFMLGAWITGFSFGFIFPISLVVLVIGVAIAFYSFYLSEARNEKSEKEMNKEMVKD